MSNIEILRSEFFSLFETKAQAINTEAEICSAVIPNLVPGAVGRVIWSGSLKDSDLVDYFDWLIGQALELANER